MKSFLVSSLALASPSALALLGFFFSGTNAQMTLDVTNQAAVVAAAKAALPNLQMFYANNNEGVGAWIESYSANRPFVQWHESGIHWGFYYEYYAYTGDNTYNDFVDTNMQLAIGSNNGFLDAISSLTGRWNDDIGWWALSVVTMAEATPGGIVDPDNIVSGDNPTYLTVANNTYWQMFEDWDTTACKGGIYWSRDRTSSAANDANYKSTITNAQHIELGARLFALTGDEIYITNANLVYAWLQSSGLIQSDYTISDGLDATTCELSPYQYSYHSGELVAGLSILYNATGQESYLTEAHNHWAHIMVSFTNYSVLMDPMGGTEDPTGFLWAVYKGIAYLHKYTTDANVKTEIETVMAASAAKNFEHCNSNWYCIRNFPADTNHTMSNGTNVRDQFETVSILNSLASITGASWTTTSSQSTSSSSSGSSSGSSSSSSSSSSSGSTSSAASSSSKLPIYIGIGAGVAVLAAAVGLALFLRKRKHDREAAERRVRKKVSEGIYDDRKRRNDDYGMKGRVSPSAVGGPLGFASPVPGVGGRTGSAGDDRGPSRNRGGNDYEKRGGSNGGGSRGGASGGARGGSGGSGDREMRNGGYTSTGGRGGDGSRAAGGSQGPRSSPQSQRGGGSTGGRGGGRSGGGRDRY
ncbi:hydrolase 76 protein [Physocladia obscura]|uniref:mannan endo-1,6-alpha-mannosidase n=1 Tax=Physocladia obscura TaxID=109957 RepID=A0AAD5SPF3_9FUNG|nr:hydrolase 76 protein [Physocladia obscura]